MILFSLLFFFFNDIIILGDNMKLMIVSDIHGNLDATRHIIDLFKQNNADKLIILGDIYQGYSLEDSSELMNLFSQMITKIYLIRGNCDSSYFIEASPVGMQQELKIEFGKRTIYFNHGHKGMPCVEFKPKDIYCHGHTHIPKITLYHDIIICCPGSCSLPRGGSKASYMIITDNDITIYDLSNNIINKYDLENSI